MVTVRTVVSLIARITAATKGRGQMQQHTYSDRKKVAYPAQSRCARGAFVGLLVAFAISVGGCSLVKTKSKKDALKDIEWNYEQEGIELSVRAHDDLNRWGGQPHTLLMLVAQLEDPSAFEPYTAGSDKLSALLLTETAPNGLLTLQKYFIEPGAERTIRLARVEKARYVALAMGYQHLDPARSTRLYQIGADLDYDGLVLREYRAAPEPLHIRVLLGAESIQDSLTARRTEIEPVQPKTGILVPERTPVTNPVSSEPAVDVQRIPSQPPAPGTL